MDVEHQLLHDHEGCFKCRRFYVTHRGNDCLNGFPDPANLQALTEQQAHTVDKLHTTVVVLVMILVLLLLASYHFHKIHCLFWQWLRFRGRQLVCTTFCCHSVTRPCFWHCHINRPTLPHSVTVKGLIDDGAQVVLIQDSLVCWTGLHLCPLHTPFSLGTAFDDDDASPEQLVATHWVKLALSFLGFHLHFSHCLCLCLSGLPCRTDCSWHAFFAHNHFVIDHELCTCIEKDTSYDIVANCLVSEPPPCSAALQFPKVKCLEICNIVKILFCEGIYRVGRC